MKAFYDLHIHSCLSPCGDDEMTPNNIVGMASLLGLEIIAIADHNSCKNLPAVKILADKAGILLIPALEVCTAEEVHILCYFNTVEIAVAFSDELYQYLPDMECSPSIFGNQYIMDENDEIIGTEPKLLINALSINIDRLLEIGKKYNAVIIPAHIDKQANSIISNLGYIPKEYGFTTAEQRDITAQMGFDGFIISDSDAHQLESLKDASNILEIDEKTVEATLRQLRIGNVNKVVDK